MFQFTPLSEEDARDILAWHYPEPYTFYDPASDPDDASLFLDEGYRTRHLLAARDDTGRLRGFFELHASDGVVEVGLGLRPDDTGQGLGSSFLEAGLRHARATLHPHTFRLYVAAFNQRAIKVYLRAGFWEVGRETRRLANLSWEFLIMERAA